MRIKFLKVTILWIHSQDGKGKYTMQRWASALDNLTIWSFAATGFWKRRVIIAGADIQLQEKKKKKIHQLGVAVSMEEVFAPFPICKGVHWMTNLYHLKMSPAVWTMEHLAQIDYRSSWAVHSTLTLGKNASSCTDLLLFGRLNFLYQ